MKRHVLGLDENDEDIKLPPPPPPTKRSLITHTPPTRPPTGVPPFLPALASRRLETGFLREKNEVPKMSAVATFPREPGFTITPRAYCVETARDAGRRGGYVAASRAFSNALVHAPGDKVVAVEFKRSVFDIRKSRPFFQLPSRRGVKKSFQRGTVEPEPEPEPEVESSDEEEDDGPARRRRAMKEFGELWMRLSRDIKEVMKKEEEAAWGVLKDFLKTQYTVLKEVFQHYCALDASLGAPAGGGGAKKAAAGGGDDMYTMSALEWLEFAKDIGVVLSRKGEKKGAASSKKNPGAGSPIKKKPEVKEPEPSTNLTEETINEEEGKGEGGEKEGGDEEGGEEKEGTTEKKATTDDAVAAVGGTTEGGETATTPEVIETETTVSPPEDGGGDAGAQDPGEPSQGKKLQQTSGSIKKPRPTVTLPIEEDVLDPVQLEETALDLIFVRANWERDDGGKFVQDDTNPDHAMLMFEFVHGMLRLAAQTFPVPKDSEHSLVDRFKTFWLKVVVPKANRANIEGFRELIQAKSVQKVLAKNELRLSAVFMNYAAAEENNDRQACMSLGEFSQLCDDAHLYCEHFTLKNAAAIYTHSQQDLDFDEVDPMDVELDFEEFKECVCRAANLINPEEFLRLSVKLEQVMELLNGLALQSVDLEHDRDYDKDGAGGEEDEDVGLVQAASGGRRDGKSEDDSSSSDDEDDDLAPDPADLHQASKRYLALE